MKNVTFAIYEAILAKVRIGAKRLEGNDISPRFGADMLLSEDLSHMQKYGSLRCNNPFAEH